MRLSTAYILGCIASAFSQQVVANLRINEVVNSLEPGVFDADVSVLDTIVIPPNIQKLIDGAGTAWTNLTNHPFTKQMANGTASLNGFRNYTIQDTYYLQWYGRVRMQSIAKPGSNASFAEILEFAAGLSQTLGYATDSFNTCTQQLGVPEEVVANAPMSTQLNGSITLYESVVNNGDWLAMNIALLPCILGYYTIGSNLTANSTTITNTPYYSLWIQPNADPSFATEFIKFINDTITERNATQAEWDYWIETFTKACGTEKNFLGLGQQASTYDIVPSATSYTIQNFGNGLYLSWDGSQVSMQKNTDSWILSPNANGYTVTNQAYSVSLVSVNATDFPTYYNVTCTNTQDAQWSVYPFSVPEGNGYQLLWTPHLQYALSADISGVASEVIAADNYEEYNQAWIIKPVT